MQLLIAFMTALLLMQPQGTQPVERPAAPDISGTWQSTFDTGVGRMDYTYEFVVKSGQLTGTATSSFGTSPLTEGKVEGNVVTFVETLDGSLRVVYRGTVVSADEIQFVREVVSIANEELVARRVKK